MKKIVMALVALFVFVATRAQQQNVNVEKNILYSVKGADSLRLDRYDGVGKEDLKPCVIFIHGGHFSFGDRDWYPGYYKWLAEQGYTVVTISYRLGFKGLNAKSLPVDNRMEYMAELFENTINMVVEDLFDATNFVLGKAGEWGVDPDLIIANGSSAGAITVLQAQYYISNGHELVEKLPEGFNYAGVSAFAGAIFAREDSLVWAKQPCPIQMFHGDADNVVPYGALRLPGVGFYGSKYIAGTLRARQTPYDFNANIDVAHQMAEAPMKERLPEIPNFFDSWVRWGNPRMQDVEHRIIGRTPKKKDFTLEDIIRSTFE